MGELRKGKYTFRHDSVLTHLVETLKKFIFELPSEPPKNCQKITFLRAGSKAHTKSKVSGILHLAKDWKIVADTHSNYVFPSHIAISELKPDLVLYSNDLKRVIIVELTCPCEENMNAWHSTKVAKYSCLMNVIMVNGWQVDFFAVEVGARGYCARTTTACLKRMGFTNKLAYSTANDLGKISMRSFFCIWLARESNVWSTDSLMQLPRSKQALPNGETKGVSSRRKGPSKKVSQNKSDTQAISVYKNIVF
ncbi:uncharacterized protein LOC130648569 [Hydractinia symbiolongicarpus]|uniref:uncharacterized protein LOC130648569 n=1 Tax=Hydractinia symbiolongicarpus TaxID=13093 RepID=UPI00254A2154|nr:uncharacterized protein LOC130648569 [Hydractinia symbiolongicarpus]